MKQIFFVILLCISFVQAQVKTPRPSPNATISQTIGITDVTITYSRPGVKGREVWGKLVPYNQVWRTGANENTTITFTDPVKIDGQTLPAGTYGLQTIPTADEWTIILSKNAKAWGAFSYKQEDDALRFKVKPQASDFQEWMSFSFENLSESSADVTLRWEKIKISFKVEFDTRNIVFNGAKGEISWNKPAQVAGYFNSVGDRLDEAMKWIDLSISIEDNYWNNRVKAQILAKTGKQADAIKTMEKAMTFSKAMKEPPFDLVDMEKLLTEWKSKSSKK